MYLDHGASSDGYNASEVGFTWKMTALKFFLSNSLMEDSAHSLYSISFIPGRRSILTTVDIQAPRISCFGKLPSAVEALTLTGLIEIIVSRRTPIINHVIFFIYHYPPFHHFFMYCLVDGLAIYLSSIHD